MSWLLKMFGSKLTLGLVIALLAAGASAAAMTKAYLGKRDALAMSQQNLALSQASLEQTRQQWEEQLSRARAAELARIALAKEVAELRDQGVETITEIREVWRDRDVFIEVPQAVECAAVSVPARVVSLLCETSGLRTGACSLRNTSDGSPADLPDSPIDG